MINDATELELDPAILPRSQTLPSITDFRAIKTSSVLGVAIPSTTVGPRASQLIVPNLRDRIKRKFDSAIAQNLVFCNSYTVEEVEGGCFKFRIITAQALSKKTFFWTSDAQGQKSTTCTVTSSSSLVPSLLKQIRPSVSRRNSQNTSNLIPNLTTFIQLKVINQCDGFPEFRKSSLPRAQTSISAALTTQPPPKPPSSSPFLPPDPALTVGPVGSGHTLVLNKYCVLPRQLLLITKDFQPQEGELRREDWKALVEVLVQLQESTSTSRVTGTTSGNLVFFNCGRNSGASQAHRHIQITEWPDSGHTEQARWFPEEVAMHLGSKTPYSHPNVSFAHFILPLPPIPPTTPSTSSTAAVYIYHKVLYQTYLTLLSYVRRAIAIHNCHNKTELPVHYNMVMTSTFMMLVPRSKGYTLANSQEVWVNSVGMLGMVWVKDREEAEGWRVVGCDRVLREVGIPR